MTYETIGKGVVKRTVRRALGLFIDGTGLDRATRRINRKVDMTSLVRGVTSGLEPVVARYYTLIPYEDDSRQRAFLDAVARAGLSVIVKRLPPKGVTRQVSVDVEMAADIVAFARGHTSFSALSEYQSQDPSLSPTQSSTLSLALPGAVKGGRGHVQKEQEETPKPTAEKEIVQEGRGNEQRVITLVCPSRDLAYPISLSKELGIDTVTADFGQFNTGDILKSAAKWIDLSDSETIWRD